jgi:dihydrofolate reductase
MKTILYMTLSIDGYLGQAGETQPIPKEILRNFMQWVGKSGNLIIGRRTYDLMHAERALGGLQGIELVIVSHTPTQNVSFVATPQAALQHLIQKGCEMALIGGGAQLNSAFLSAGLVDEIYLNINPYIANKGIRLGMTEGFEASLHLLETTQLTTNLIQLHYRIEN